VVRVLDQKLLRMCNWHVLALELGLQLGHTPRVGGQDDGAAGSHLHGVLGQLLGPAVPILLRGYSPLILQRADTIVSGGFI
jgi:hypothetical protein